MVLLVNSYQIFKEERLPIACQLFQKIEEQGAFSVPFYEINITDKGITKTKQQSFFDSPGEYRYKNLLQSIGTQHTAKCKSNLSIPCLSAPHLVHNLDKGEVNVIYWTASITNRKKRKQRRQRKREGRERKEEGKKEKGM